MTGFSSPRRTAAQIKFNGKSVTKRLKPYLESVTYTDVASGDSDQLDLTFFNLEMKWLDKWFPQKGDKVSGSLVFQNWKKGDAKRTLTIGSFVLDDISFSGGPLSAKFGCVAVPNHESFRIRERTKTWEDVRIEGIAKEIASRYDLKLKYKADNIKIKSLEQSNATDCSFLYKTCENYGLAMKVFFDSIIIYDQTDLEKKKAVSTIAREDFVDDSWT